MYPRIKVRVKEDPKGKQKEAASFLPKVVESLAVKDYLPSANRTTNCGKEDENDPPSHAKISNSLPRSALTSFIPTSTGKGGRSFDEDNNNNIRASSIPPPRAVLSSPDNDDLIRQQNRIIRERQALPKHSSTQNFQQQEKHIQRIARVNGPLGTRKVAKGTESSHTKERKIPPETAASRRKASTVESIKNN